MPSPPEADLPLMVGNDLVEVQAVTTTEPEPENETAPATGRDRHVNLVQIVRDWLWRAA
jgi:hypothetical protein